nr:hypothetical protein CFP56_31592 [Quercus suber]
MTAPNLSGPCVSMSNLPDISKTEMNFYDTSFFQEGPTVRQLPSPSSILQQSPNSASGVVKLSHLNLAVKFNSSSYLRLEEAQTLRAIRLAFPNGEIPVPEVFGWRQHEGNNFIYMQLIQGQTLREAWSSLSQTNREAICVQLSDVVRSLQRLTHDRPGLLIGSINGGSVQDRFFKLDFEKGPFLDIQSFNDWTLAAATRHIPPPVDVDGLYRDLLPDSGNVYFTHGDLTLGNIIISDTSGSWKIESIIDWEQAGWYPEYWEYCKLLYGVEYTHEWREEGWVDLVMKSFDDEWFAFAEYSLWRCP